MTEPQPSFRLTKEGLEVRRGADIEHMPLHELVARLAKIIRETKEEQHD